METMRIRFKPEEGGHEGLINSCDFNPARHIRLDEDGEPEKPKGEKKSKGEKKPKGEGEE